MGTRTITKVVTITRTIKVSFDEEKFTPEFVEEFNNSMFDCGSLDDPDDMFNEHAEHLSQFSARFGIEWFVEGYGELSEMGIVIKQVGESIEMDDAA
jgi:hypothetical protein